MQDFRSMPQSGAGSGGGGGGRFFGDRRLRPFPNQALKCPRCDSLNTKFCYYNNYNLSQPRHFCKSCRRYWTKGGVLRNVPVGGGCRKAKRSKHKSSSEKERMSNSHSSSESSSLTATTTTATVNNEAAAATTTTTTFNDVPSLLDFSDSRLFMNQPTPTLNFEMLENLENQSSGIFAENENLTSLMNVGNPFNFSDISSYRFNGNQEQQQQEMELQQQQQKIASMEEMKMQELTAGCIDQTVGIDLSGLQNRTNNGDLTALDWQSNGDQGLFDLANTVDQGGYWSQSQWNENDQHLYLP